MYMKNDARQMHTPKAAHDFRRKRTELPWARFEPATSCILDGCSINWAMYSVLSCVVHIYVGGIKASSNVMTFMYNVHVCIMCMYMYTFK